MEVTVAFRDDQIADIARQVAEDLAERDDGGYLDYTASAKFLSTTVKAVERMKAKGILVPDGHLGRKPLFKKSTLRAAVES